jgi:hypothetical protein
LEKNTHYFAFSCNQYDHEKIIRLKIDKKRKKTPKNAPKTRKNYKNHSKNPITPKIHQKHTKNTQKPQKIAKKGITHTQKKKKKKKKKHANSIKKKNAFAGEKNAKNGAKIEKKKNR